MHFKNGFVSNTCTIKCQNKTENHIIIDILINNAGVSSSGMSWKLSIDEWNHTLNSNITTAFLASKHAIPMMRERQWGRIINIASVVAQIGMPGTSAYAASKSLSISAIISCFDFSSK